MSLRHTIAYMLAATIACACSDKARPVPQSASPFPELPTTAPAIDALIAQETKRAPPNSDPGIDASSILAAAEARGLGMLPSGQRQIVRFLQAILDSAPLDAVLVFGTWHDAPGHIDAFRRLVGPGGLRGLSLVAAEQFRADGAWKGAPEDAQRGDAELLYAWSTRGDAAAFAALADRHRESDYAAWKLGYEETAMDLLVSTRAAGNRLVGCDMPARLQALSGAEGEARNRLREIHCLRSLPISQGNAPRRIAMIWGDAHTRKSGIQRFLPPSLVAVSIHVVGRRQVPGAVEVGLASRLSVNDPVLVPISDAEAALILPDETLGGRVDRVLTSLDGGQAITGLVVTAEIDGKLQVGNRSFDVGREAVTVPLPPGDHTYAFTAKGRSIVGAVAITARHRVDLTFDPEAKLTSYVERMAP